MTCDVQPEVPSTSLTTTYIPPAVAKAQFSKGWNLCFDEAGFLPSLHTTSLDGSFTILRWHGKGIDLYGNVTTHANYTIKIDGADIPTASKVAQLPDSVLASFTDLPCADHTLVLTLHVPEDDDTHSLTFDKAVITQHASYASNILDAPWPTRAERGEVSTETTPPGDFAQATITGATLYPTSHSPLLEHFAQ
ncbi:hypothetical protein CYLTODRAFT_71955 [Cylindrobasidium torrendii FP15055 ss-10]|uniref:Uncharacterized protein n=1 Tax=Cylindrobasidium torrendii FP15055 ss-10 TaxID=1314674 RepID=A0A0D7BR78_9AGAR|nr:hypothetical protein CYLTODRAFT_71955 [Cylindrobasidium torrendii FP15055 ss-10]